MLTDSERHSLAANDQLTFTATLWKLVARISKAEAPGEMLRDALVVIAASSIPVSQQSQRAALLVRHATFDISVDADLLRGLSQLPGPVRMGIASALPPVGLSHFYRGTSEAVDSTHAAAAASDRHGQADPARGAKTTGPRAPGAVPETVPARERGTVIILLSVADNQDANMRLLRNDGFGTYRVTSPKDLDIYLGSSDVCGIVVDGSFWAEKSADEQDLILTKISGYSSFACLIVDLTAFHHSTQAHSIVCNARLTEPTCSQLLLRSNSILSEVDVEYFRVASETISPAIQPRFIPADLSESELAALVISANSFFRREYQRSGETLSSLRFSTMQSGCSGAKLFLLHFNGAGVPIVAKVGARPTICDEADRFDTYIRRWDGQLRPRVQFHGDVGVIIFGLIEDSARPFCPAPTLAEKIRAVSHSEVWDGVTSDLGRNCEGISLAIERTCDKLVSLNRLPCSDSQHSSYAYLRGSAFRKLTENGVRWELPNAGVCTIQECIEAAHARVEPLRSAATVHGDLHLLNVLVPHDGTPYVIDYAYSGPGHPAYDLARFECALCFRYLRSLGTEDGFARLQHALSVEMADAEQLEQGFPAWWSSAVNRMLLKGAITCRDRCMEVLSSFGGGHDDYMAAKFLLCCWSLTIPDLQLGLVRGAIRALAPALGVSRLTT